MSILPMSSILTLEKLLDLRKQMDALMSEPHYVSAHKIGGPGDGLFSVDPPVLMRIVESLYHGTMVQVRFPRTKNTRIRNKWKKDLKNFVWKLNPDIIATPAGLVMSPVMARRLREYGAMFNPRTGQTIFV